MQNPWIERGDLHGVIIASPSGNLYSTLLGWLIVPIIQIIRHRNDSKKALERYASEEKRLFMKRDERVKNIENTIKETEAAKRTIQDAIRTLR